MIDNKREYTSHLFGLFKRFSSLGKENQLVFILDWNSNLEIKKQIRAKREEEKKQRELRIEKYLEDIRTFSLAKAEIQRRTNFKINYEFLEEVFDSLGWILLKATEADAEKYGAKLVINKVLDYFVTTDSDTLLFGSDYVKNITKDSVDSSSYLFEICSLEDTLKENQVDYEVLVSAGVVTGTDYHKGVSGIGPRRAFRYLQKNRLDQEMMYIFKYFTQISEDIPKKIEVRKKEDYEIKLVFWKKKLDFKEILK